MSADIIKYYFDFRKLELEKIDFKRAREKGLDQGAKVLKIKSKGARELMLSYLLFLRSTIPCSSSTNSFLKSDMSPEAARRGGGASRAKFLFLF